MTYVDPETPRRVHEAAVLVAIALDLLNEAVHKLSAVDPFLREFRFFRRAIDNLPVPDRHLPAPLPVADRLRAKLVVDIEQAVEAHLNRETTP